MDLGFKLMVKDEKLWISNEEMHHIPDAIQKEYFYLKENIQKDDICGALFRLKDIYEISMKIPAIMAVISISSYMEEHCEFIRKTTGQLALKQSNYMQGKSDEIEEESETFKKFGEILSRLLREPLAIGSWRELIETIVKYSDAFELDENLVTILSRTLQLFNVKPQKANGESGRYENVGNWRNKTIGHGTLLINTDDYWEQAYDLVEGLYTYFSKDAEGVSLNACYESIYITKEEDDKYILHIDGKELAVSEYIYHFDDEHYFFDSYYSRQKYTEVANYFSAPKRLKSNSYYQGLYHLIDSEKKSSPKKKGRQVTNSADREMYACLNNVPDYERPDFVIDEIAEFINKNNKGVLYIQMERGMGKSTLAHRLDGRYQKGILQKDLNAVVRVYHISDMRLRGETRTRDFFTALNTNLISYEGGQLEVDNDDYYDSKGNDLRKLIESDTEDARTAQIAFSEYLELFRCLYEYELYGDTEGNEVNLVYIIDGIDELNSDTKSILNAIPSDDLLRGLPEETVNHVYIVLLSRTKEEESLPDVARECVDISEQKAGKIFAVDSDNKEYISLLKKYIMCNYKGMSETACEDIMERAQRKFLYVQPYMAFGDAVMKTDGEITADTVAENYVTELKKMYRGVSSNTLQLILSAIAVFHSISLKEMCGLVLFTDVSYDVIGVLNDILPLLAVRRTDGDDVYEFANEGYEQYVLDNLREPVCEVICRFRVSVNSWFERVDRESKSYGKEWGYYVQKILHVDNPAKVIHFEEADEEYVKSLIDLSWHTPSTIYSRDVSEALKVNIIDQLKALNYKELTVITKDRLEHVGLPFYSRRMWSDLDKKLSEYTQGMIAHCMANPKIDNWFKVLTECDHGVLLVDFYRDEKARVSAFREIVGQWADKNEVVQYFCDKAKMDYRWSLSRYKADYRLCGLYLEELLSMVETEPLRKKIYEGLLYVCGTFVMEKQGAGWKDSDDDRRETILRIVDEAAAYKDLPNYDLIYDIKTRLFDENIVDKRISELEDLSGEIHDFSVNEHRRKLDGLLMTEDVLNEEQLARYKEAGKLYFNTVLDYLRNTYDGNDADDIHKWLRFLYDKLLSDNMLLSFCSDDKSEIEELLNLCESLVTVYAERSETYKMRDISFPYSRALELYDEIFRHSNIGFYRHRSHEPVDVSLKMTSWEKTYALYCSNFGAGHAFYSILKKGAWDKFPCFPNCFIDKLLQELYDEKEYEKYRSLNEQIEQTYSSLGRADDYLFDEEFFDFSLIKEYYSWITARYYRSLEGGDSLTSDALHDRLMEGYNGVFKKILSLLNEGEDIVHISTAEVDLLFCSDLIADLNKIIPDSITLSNDSKNKFIGELEELRKKYSYQKKINERIDEIIVRVNELSTGCDSAPQE